MDIINLSSNLLKSVAFEIFNPISLIFNKSLESGMVPRKLKVSRTVAIYESGSPSDLTNYRPISCLPILSKIIEKMVTKQLNDLKTNNLLNKHQYSFCLINLLFTPYYMPLTSFQKQLVIIN